MRSLHFKAGTVGNVEQVGQLAEEHLPEEPRDGAARKTAHKSDDLRYYVLYIR
jgi:hypothetical protein